MRVPRWSAGDNRRGPQQDRRRVIEALTLLPAEEREILLRAHYWGWPVERIARHFEIPDDLVKLRLHEALERLRAFEGRR
ncbi:MULTISPECIES: sigma factor-like helix-turn-helix DNA-binding protein [unclassified Mycobacterium]|uniref:sigma factor-like helix-turn-helix DNA-binding protein n=1 Tax=unclassified Mycobacterium TaxID=2642494 RepID=UPI0029C8CF7B|nr:MULTISPECIES: sigma factor-like helix-turn-helix DNA-binding protein [unclassified Mycobacterium]